MIKTFQRDTFSVRVNRHKGGIFYCLFDITRSLKMKNGKTIKNAIERAYKCQLKKFKIDTDHYSFLTQEQLEYFLRLYSTSADFNAFIREIPYWYKSQEAKEVIVKESQVVEPQVSMPSVVNSVGSISKVDNATSLQVFNYGHSTLDYGILNGEPVFNLNYIGALLEIANPRMSIDISDKDYVVKIDNSVVSFTYNRNLNNRGELFLTEAGLYRLLLRSNKPEAEKFSKWVTKEVLPSIRKTGSYQVEQKPAIPQTYAEALLEAGRLALENEKLQAQAIENAPKVVAYDKLMDTHNNISVKEFGKIIGIGEKNLFEWLRNNKYLMSDNNPYQKYMDRGYFEVVEKTYTTNDREKSYTQTLITPKGQGYLSNKLKS